VCVDHVGWVSVSKCMRRLRVSVQLERVEGCECREGWVFINNMTSPAATEGGGWIGLVERLLINLESYCNAPPINNTASGRGEG
jgi:hypothetical protein